jgi:ACS family pantothenate transporter-like MFS transporter
LYGNQLNYMQTCWTIGYVIGEIPSNIILTRIRPSIWIPAMEASFATSFVAHLLMTTANLGRPYLLPFPREQCANDLRATLSNR